MEFNKKFNFLKNKRWRGEGRRGIKKSRKAACVQEEKSALSDLTFFYVFQRFFWIFDSLAWSDSFIKSESQNNFEFLIEWDPSEIPRCFRSEVVVIQTDRQTVTSTIVHFLYIFWKCLYSPPPLPPSTLIFQKVKFFIEFHMERTSLKVHSPPFY